MSALVGSSLGVVSALIGCCEYTQREFSGHSYSAGYVNALLALQPHLVGVEITLTHNMHTKNVRDKTDYSLKMTSLHLVKATSCSKHREKPLK